MLEKVVQCYFGGITVGPVARGGRSCHVVGAAVMRDAWENRIASALWRCRSACLFDEVGSSCYLLSTPGSKLDGVTL